MEMLGEIGASDLVRRTGQLYLYPDEKGLAKDAMTWALRRQHGLAVERFSRADILALEPEVGPDYAIGMFTWRPVKLCNSVARSIGRGFRHAQERATHLAFGRKPAHRA